jgi:hypothetical protein
MLFFLPLNLIQVQGYDPALAGLTQPPLGAVDFASLALLAASWIAAGLCMPLTIGPLVAGVGFWLFSLPLTTAGPRELPRRFFRAAVGGAGLGSTARH